MKIKFLKSHPAYGYFAGQKGEVADDKAKELIKDKYAVAVVKKEKTDEGSKTQEK